MIPIILPIELREIILNYFSDEKKFELYKYNIITKGMKISLNDSYNVNYGLPNYIMGLFKDISWRGFNYILS